VDLYSAYYCRDNVSRINPGYKKTIYKKVKNETCTSWYHKKSTYKIPGTFPKLSQIKLAIWCFANCTHFGRTLWKNHTKKLVTVKYTRMSSLCLQNLEAEKVAPKTATLKCMAELLAMQFNEQRLSNWVKCPPLPAPSQTPHPGHMLSWLRTQVNDLPSLWCNSSMSDYSDRAALLLTYL